MAWSQQTAYNHLTQKVSHRASQSWSSKKLWPAGSSCMVLHQARPKGFSWSPAKLLLFREITYPTSSSIISSYTQQIVRSIAPSLAKLMKFRLSNQLRGDQLRCGKEFSFMWIIKDSDNVYRETIFIGTLPWWPIQTFYTNRKHGLEIFSQAPDMETRSL